MYNIIRVKISNFIRNHKDKIKNLGQKLIMVAMGVFIATVILSALSNINNEKIDEDVYNIYKPTQTVIDGSDISKEEFEEDSNLVNTFLEYCNNGDAETAYSLLSDECKTESYPTIERFKNNYYNIIFNRKRECNLQAWISTSEYIVYKVRYANNMLATGTYDENDVYQDYLTLNRKKDTEKISIGNFVDSEECNITTITEELEATVIKKSIYMTYEEYEIDIKNNTDKTILLNNLEDNSTIKLISKSGTQYGAYTNKFFITDLLITPNEVRTINIRFKKHLNSEYLSGRIELLNIIRDYETYQQNSKEYVDTTSITIKVED